ncbi:MAG: NAD(+) kinase, partial [Bacillota bacterium]
MPAAFKTVAVVGKSDAASLPSVLDELAMVLRRSGVAVLMEEATAQASRQVPDGTFTLDAFAANADLTIVVGG